MNQHILLLGGIIIDEYLLVSEFPTRGEDTFIRDSFQQVGGCAINVAVTLKNLGLIPHVVSVIGADDRGKEIDNYLQNQGLSREAIQVNPKEKTGYCISLVEKSGERTFMTFKGCESQFYTELISDQLLENTSFLFVTGYYLLDFKFASTIITFIQKIKELGVKILFDPGSLLSKIDQNILLSMIKLSDIITPNSGELEKLISLFEIEKENCPEWFFKHGVSWLIEKRGNHGVNLWENRSDKNLFIPTYQVKSIDTSGAGDSFAGGLIYGILQGYNMQKSVMLANACGAITTTYMGPHIKFNLNDILKIAGEY
ncbi:carbohydrate kinase family protein [Neobacillus niacini]|nr:carbohydrate kinase family protein [Neobacillus niacini]MEC1522807.1 carbohydrate kinase family protein [Neobacillus niacini]